MKVSMDEQGRKTITEVRVEDRAGVAAGLLRQIPLGALEDVLNGPQVSLGLIDQTARIFPPTIIQSASQAVVNAYSAAAAVTRHPVRKLAEDYGVSERTVSRWLADARREGLLPPPRRTRRS
jgi:hypothetical protein